MTTFDEYLRRVQERDTPTNPMNRLRAFARELAEGAAAGYWPVQFFFQTFFNIPGHEGEELYLPEPATMREYLLRRWGAKDYPGLTLLETNGFLTRLREDRFSPTFAITQAAFDLIDEVEPTTIFISYKRSESSAFALLLVARLKSAGLNPFLDMALVPGENWQARLEDRVRHADVFILLLGQRTLESAVTRQEIAWALDAGCTIIPIWHNGFEYRRDDWAGLAGWLDDLLRNTHTIRVTEENPVAYNSAVVELLNQFGVTP